MLGYAHSGFSVDADACIQVHERAALVPLLRYYARPPLAMERLRIAGAALVYLCQKQCSKPGSYHHVDKRGSEADELHLTPLELIARTAALVPPPRTHMRRYFGVPGPNSPHRAAVIAMAATLAQVAAVQTPPDTLLAATRGTTHTCIHSPRPLNITGRVRTGRHFTPA
jgi:hypothetical protein